MSSSSILSIEVDSLTQETTLAFSLSDTNWEDTLELLTKLKADELSKAFITDKCLRNLSDVAITKLAKTLVQQRAPDSKEYLKEVDIIKSFTHSCFLYTESKTAKTTFWYKTFRKMTENIVRNSQVGLHMEELKKTPEWDKLSWGRIGDSNA